MNDNDWPFQYAVVPIQRFIIDHRYQRDTKSLWIEQMLPNFDLRLVFALYGSVRKNDEIGLVDGQQRLGLLREKGYTTAPVLLLHGLSWREEAALFAHFNFDRSKVHAWYHYRALLESRDPEIVAIDKLVTAHGFKLGKSVEPEDMIGAISTIIAIYAADADIARAGSDAEGPEILDRTISAIAIAWRDRLPGLQREWRTAKTGGMLRGIGRYFFAHPEVSSEQLGDRLAPILPTNVMDAARKVSPGQGSGKGRGVEAIVSAIMDGKNPQKRRAA